MRTLADREELPLLGVAGPGLALQRAGRSGRVMLVVDARASRRGQLMARDPPRPPIGVDVHDHELLALGADQDALADQRVRDRLDRIPHADGRLAVDLAGLSETQRVRQPWQPVHVLVLCSSNTTAG